MTAVPGAGRRLQRSDCRNSPPSSRSSSRCLPPTVPPPPHPPSFPAPPVAIRASPRDWEPASHDRRRARGAPTPPIAARRPAGTPRPRRRLASTTMPGFAPTTGARCCAIPAALPPTSARCSRRRTPMPTKFSAPTRALAAPARARNARAAEGGRQRGSADATAPTPIIRASATAASTASSAAGRARGGKETILHRRRRARRRARRSSTCRARAPFARPSQARLERRRQGLGDVRDPRARRRRRGRPCRSRRERRPAKRCGRAIRAAFSMSRRTKTIARGG